jgi:hypothetical protein
LRPFRLADRVQYSPTQSSPLRVGQWFTLSPSQEEILPIDDVPQLLGDRVGENPRGAACRCCSEHPPTRARAA